MNFLIEIDKANFSIGNITKLLKIDRFLTLKIEKTTEKKFSMEKLFKSETFRNLIQWGMMNLVVCYPTGL